MENPLAVVHARGDVARECGGSRDAGDVYAETGFSPFGLPLEAHLFDPIEKFDKNKWGLSPRRPIVVEIDDVWYIIDWVGENAYPNPSDFLEEVRKWGLSRKLELSADEYAKLTNKSKILIVLPNAWIEPEVLQLTKGDFLPMDAIGYKWVRCPKDYHTKDAVKARTCAGWLWHRCDTKTKDHPLTETLKNGRYVRREMAQFTYAAAASWPVLMESAATQPEAFQPGMVAAFPITRLAVVVDPDSDTHLKKLEKLAGCVLPVDQVDM